MSYLQKYHELIEQGSEVYLCFIFNPNKSLLKLFLPTPQELNEHFSQGWNERAWGSMQGACGARFNEFRQNIVLFMAAMNNEL